MYETLISLFASNNDSANEVNLTLSALLLLPPTQTGFGNKNLPLALITTISPFPAAIAYARCDREIDAIVTSISFITSININRWVPYRTR